MNLQPTLMGSWSHVCSMCYYVPNIRPERMLNNKKLRDFPPNHLLFYSIWYDSYLLRIWDFRPKGHIWKSSVCYQCQLTHTHNLFQQMCKERQQMLQSTSAVITSCLCVCKVLFVFQSTLIAQIQSETGEYCELAWGHHQLCKEPGRNTFIERDKIFEVDLRRKVWGAFWLEAWRWRSGHGKGGRWGSDQEEGMEGGKTRPRRTWKPVRELQRNLSRSRWWEGQAN